MTTLAWTYAAYLVVSIGLTVWVARVLRRSGGVILTSGVPQRLDVAAALADLLVVGYYLLNLGFICLSLRAHTRADTLDTAIELLSAKVGAVLFGLGVMHFLVLALIGMIRGSAKSAGAFEPDSGAFEAT